LKLSNKKLKTKELKTVQGMEALVKFAMISDCTGCLIKKI
jgi:hypothetical protein